MQGTALVARKCVCVCECVREGEPYRSRKREREKESERVCLRVSVRWCLRPRFGLIRSLAIYRTQDGVTSSVKMSTIQQLKNFIRHGMLCSFLSFQTSAPRLCPLFVVLHMGAFSTHHHHQTTACYLFPQPSHPSPMAHGFSVASSFSAAHLHLPHHNQLLPQMTPTDRLPQASKLAHQTPTRLRGKTTSRRLNHNLCQCPTRSCKQIPALVLRLATSSQCPTRTRQPQATM